MKIPILEVKIDNLSLKEVLEKIKSFLIDGKQHYLVTPNPEFLVAAQKDEEFKNILNKADLAIPDGFGLILVGWIFKTPFKERITGTDLMKKICSFNEISNYKIFLLGAAEGVARKVAKKLKVKNPYLNIVGTFTGNSNPDGDKETVEIINKAQPNILFVAYGQVKQEKWINRNLAKIPSVKIALGVGGAFDYLSGKVKRAPKILRSMGLEWLFRLIREPRRLKRIYNAVIKFPLLVIKLRNIKNI